ncbi:MAG: bacterial transcriptional activator domain-containing protein [Anaerolineae bacterium]|nr:bacterial transcriptional activator domain-containing protein [Anaerolineae bacterium]MCB9102398.1 hypothetical protein [Anaerolineales bacterium]MCB9107687.1 hypothetical protein [Anaerolineales bacterium]
MLTLKFFGSGQAQYLDHPLVGFPNQHCYYLLCYLVIYRDQSHDRERLAVTLWRENDTNDPRKQLRNALWRLRQALKAVDASHEDYLSSTNEEITFIHTDQVWLDIEHFEKTNEQYQEIPGEQLTPDQARQLEAALQLYTGDLLKNIDEDWCLYEREWLRKLWLTGMNKLLDYFEATKSYEHALHYGQKILEYDNVYERIHLRIMRLYWQLGDRHAAIRQYRRCVQILRDELDVPPMPETEQLYQRLLSNGLDPSQPSPTATASFSHQTVSNQDLVKHALRRVQQLKLIIEEAHTEIHRLEALFDQRLP